MGYGGQGSFLPGTNEIHNGADDNGSGTAALLEVARRLATREKKLPRRIVFIAFTGEERGLIGSARYCSEPLLPLEKTIAMLNMDMVGRLNDEKLIVHGIDTAAEFEPLIDELNKRYRLRPLEEDRRLRPQRSLLVLRQEDSGAALLHRPAQGLSPAERRLRQAQRAGHAARGRDGGRHRGRPGRSRPTARSWSRASRRPLRAAATATGPTSAASPISRRSSRATASAA